MARRGDGAIVTIASWKKHFMGMRESPTISTFFLFPLLLQTVADLFLNSKSSILTPCYSVVLGKYSFFCELA